MKNETKLIFTFWLKRLIGVIAGILWISIIYNISQSSAPFIEQAPYCMGSTMLIFGLLTAIHKGLDYWSLKNK
jgi:peptidoglycan/LPS O-acetylase OafA/YrhL